MLTFRICRMIVVQYEVDFLHTNIRSRKGIKRFTERNFHELTDTCIHVRTGNLWSVIFWWAKQSGTEDKDKDIDVHFPLSSRVRTMSLRVSAQDPPGCGTDAWLIAKLHTITLTLTWAVLPICNSKIFDRWLFNRVLARPLADGHLVDCCTIWMWEIQARAPLPKPCP